MSEEMVSKFDEAIDDFVVASVRVRRNKAGVQNLYQFAAAVTLFVLIYLALRVGSMSLATLGVFLFAMFRLSPIVSNLNEKAYTVATNLPHLVRTEEFVEELEQKSEAQSEGRPVPEQIESVAFQDVRFSYDEEEVIRGISFGFDRGEFVAFVGQSGAGKSTIALLLAQLYEPDSGAITANGTPISEFDVSEWRSKIAVVRQNPFIFNETLRFNLTIGNRDASQEEIERVCEIAQVTEFLDDLPDGYDSILGDNGVQLSGGQKQRVAIARALLKDADVLILDEATSDLDTTLEETIQAKLEAAAKEYMTVAIAHRLSTVKNADKIYTIEDGQITEAGEHAELIDQDGKYSELYQSQVAN
jgi:subfamily B ATP-binding cassette protein MsbA